MKELVVPEPLDGLRAELERIDAQLVDMLAKRCALSRRAAAAKTAARLPVVDPAREAAVVRRVAGLAREKDLDEEATRRIFWCIIELSRRVQLEQATGA